MAHGGPVSAERRRWLALGLANLVLSGLFFAVLAPPTEGRSRTFLTIVGVLLVLLALFSFARVRSAGRS